MGLPLYLCAAVWWWLRGPHAWSANNARNVGTGGELNNNNAYNGSSVAADCVAWASRPVSVSK